MKKTFRVIAIVVAIALVIGAIPAAFSLSNVNYKKSWADPLPLVLIPDSSYPIIVGNGIDNYNRIYLSDTLQSQRLMLEYGKTHGGINIGEGYWEESDHPLDFTVSPATMEAYGLTKATLKQYLRQYHYSRPDMTLLSYDGGEWTSHREFNQDDILPLKDISIAFADSFDLYPKDSWYMHIGGNRLEAYVVGNPTFNFFMTNGPELRNTAYAPADGILYDAAIVEGHADPLQILFSAEEETIYDEDTWEPIGTADDIDLYEEAPSVVTIRGIDNSYSAPVESIAQSAEIDTNDEISYIIGKDILDNLEAGLYHIEFPFEKGTSIFILQVNEAPCAGETDCLSADFTDVDPTKWYHAAVDFALDQGIMVGLGGNRFGTDRAVSRAQFVTILWALENKPTASGDHPFTDVAEDAWYDAAVAWSYGEGLVSGTSATTFDPSALLSRQQAALILHQYARSIGDGELSSVDYDILNRYEDGSTTAFWAEDAMIWACNKGLLSGTGNNTLDPAGQVTRAQIAQIMMAYLN